MDKNAPLNQLPPNQIPKKNPISKMLGNTLIMKKLIESISWKTLYSHSFVVLLLAFIALLYFNPLLSGKVLLQSDIQQYKGMSRQMKEARDASPPVETYWIDNSFLGMPTYQLGAEYPADFLMPFYYITRILPRPANLLFLYFLGGYLLLSVLGLRRTYAIMGALSFGFSTYLLIILQVGHNTKAEAIGYFPFVLAGLLLLLQNKRLMGWLLSTLGLGMQIRANHYQMTYYLLFLLFIFGLVYFWEAFKKKDVNNFFFQIILFASAGILALGLNATPLLATQEYTQFSTRGPSELRMQPNGTPKENTSGLDYNYITQYSYGLFESFSLLFPRIQGGGSREDVGTESSLYYYLIGRGVPVQQAASFVSAVPTYWGDQPILEAPAYIGITIFFLALLGFRSTRGPLRKSLILVIIVSLLLSWGKNVPWLTNLLIDYFPLYNKFRAVSSAQVLLELCTPILAVWGLAQFFDKEKHEQIKILRGTSILFGALVLSLFALKGMLSFQGAMDSYLRQGYGNAIFQQIVETRKSLYNQDILRGMIFIFGMAVALYLGSREKLKSKQVLGILFILVIADLLQVAERYMDRDLFVSSRSARQVFVSSAADRTILQDKGHYRVYDSDAQLKSPRTAYFHHALGGYHGAKPRRIQEVYDFFMEYRAESILNMLNVKYILYKEEEQQKVLVNPQALGIAWPVDSLVMVKDADTELNYLKELDLSRQAVLQSGQLPNDFISPQFIDSSFNISLVKNYPNKLTYQYEIKRDQFVVFSEAYYQKGWKAYVEKKEVPIYKVNFLLRGLWLPASAKEIRFEFQPPVVQLGTQIRWGSLFLFFISLGGALWYDNKAKR